MCLNSSSRRLLSEQMELADPILTNDRPLHLLPHGGWSRDSANARSGSTMQIGFSYFLCLIEATKITDSGVFFDFYLALKK
jgi:hypothetical protein